MEKLTEKVAVTHQLPPTPESLQFSVRERLPLPGQTGEDGNAKPIYWPAGGIPPVVDSPQLLTRALEVLGQADGPIAIDTERACGFRYDTTVAYLVQLKRGNSSVVMLDGPALKKFHPQIAQVVNAPQWILHAADQDMPSLAKMGLKPSSLFDTLVAAQILGLPKFNLGFLTQYLLGYELAKEHSNSDWSKRPLPSTWLAYAALDVELLGPLQQKLSTMLIEAGREKWAEEEFAHLLTFKQVKKPDPWRHVSHSGLVRTARGRQMLKNLYEMREDLAREKNLSTHFFLPAKTMSLAAAMLPKTRKDLAKIPGFNDPAVSKYMHLWWSAIAKAWRTADDLLPSSQVPRLPGELPHASNWKAHHPEASELLKRLQALVTERAATLQIFEPRLLDPKSCRILAWNLAKSGHLHPNVKQTESALLLSGARPWQTQQLAAYLSKGLR